MRTTPDAGWPAPVAGIAFGIRWLWLILLPVVAAHDGRLTGAAAVALGIWATASLALAIAWALHLRPAWGPMALVAVDAACALAAIGTSGWLLSPLWSGLLVPVVTLGLWRGFGPAWALAAAEGVWTGGAALALGADPRAMTGIALAYLSMLIAGGALLGWLASRARMAGQARILADEVRPPYLQVRRLLDIMAELGSSASPDRVPDMTLDLCSEVLQMVGGDPDGLVSAVVVEKSGAWRVAAARRLPQSDRQLVVTKEPGGESLGAPVAHRADPQADRLFRRFEGFADCRSGVFLPLTSASIQGAVLLAHPQEAFFTDRLADLLAGVARQAIVAAGNASRCDELAAELTRLTEVEEEARRKMARDLHDGPTQAIAAIAMRADYVRRQIERDPAVAVEEIRRLEDQARTTTRDLRHMLFTLRPLILESQGILAALRQLADKERETHGQNITFEADPEAAEGIDEARQAVVFYIAEEAISNARKHAAAEHVWLRMTRRGGSVVLEVRDDGVGFNVGAIDADYAQRGSLGMVNMRERSELIGASLRVESSEGHGTSVTLTLPFSGER